MVILCPNAHPPTPADWSDEMSVSASEIEKAKSRDRNRLPRQYTQEYRLEAVGYYRKARKADPKKSIRECVAELGINDKTLNDWILKYSKTGKVTQERTDEQKELDAARRHIHELESENEFLKKPQPSLPGASDVGLTCIVFSDSAEAAASIDIHVPAQELATLASEKGHGRERDRCGQDGLHVSRRAEEAEDGGHAAAPQ